MIVSMRETGDTSGRARRLATAGPNSGRSAEQAPAQRQSPLPAYYRIANLLGSHIMTGHHAPGSLLGTEKEMAENFGVSRITIRQAFDLLEKQNLIERRRAKGTFVASHIEPRASVELNGLLDDILLQADTGGTVFVDRKLKPATRQVAEKLGIAPRSQVYLIRRLRVTHTEPHVPKSWLLNYVPVKIGRKYSEDTLRTNSFLQLLDHDPQTRLGWGEQEIGAGAADAETARRLAVEPGSPVLVVERVVYSERGEAVEFVVMRYRRDQMEFGVHLDRIRV